MVVFATLVLTFVTRALATCVAAAAAATYPARACAPRRATDWLARRAFDVGYAVYASRVGRYVHGKMVEASREDSAHSKAETARVIGGCVVATTPFLRDNYSYVVVDAETREAAAIDPADPEATMRAVDYSTDPMVSDEQFRGQALAAIAHAANEIELALGSPQDIEGCIAADGALYVVQTRPQV